MIPIITPQMVRRSRQMDVARRDFKVILICERMPGWSHYFIFGLIVDIRLQKGTQKYIKTGLNPTWEESLLDFLKCLL
jgi:hypothetical protein